ncbi:MAG: peptidylprolyl isomerase [Saprospiraceae bacterium]|nr:peptidylprolyl isomerase [Saprospiraceae bacterium]
MQNFLVFLWLILLAGCSGPKAYFETGELKNITPETVYFSNLSSKADHFFWDFGTGIKSTEKNPSFRYLTSGRYIVKLTAFKKKKKSTFSKEILFVAPSDCLIEVKTSKGSFLIKLHEETPLHNENFLKLIQQEFYTGTIFHRVINGFMIQERDPETKHPQKIFVMVMVVRVIPFHQKFMTNIFISRAHWPLPESVMNSTLKKNLQGHSFISFMEDQ